MSYTDDTVKQPFGLTSIQNIKTGRIPHHRTAYEGVMYDSKAEATYARHLDYLRYAHNINERVKKVERQVKYPIIIKKKHIFDYLADFRVTYHDGRVEVIDVKSAYTKKDPVYRIKKKAVEAEYGIIVMEKT